MLNSNSITSVGGSAFAGCNNILIDSNSIPPSMFNGVISLTKVYFTNNIVTISASAFKACTGLTYINLVNVNTIEASAFETCNNLKNVVSYANPLTLANRTNVFALKDTTDATIYTNDPTANYLSDYFTTIITQTSTTPISNIIPHQFNTQSLYNIVSLYGNTYYINSSDQYENYGIPQSTQSSKLNYVDPTKDTSNLQPGLQYVIYNKSGIPQYIQFYPYCNTKNSANATGGASVVNVFSIANNVCTIQPNCVISFIYVGTTDTSSEGYITGYANSNI